MNKSLFMISSDTQSLHSGKNSKDDHHETLDVSKYTLSRKQVSKFLDELISA